MKKRYPIPQLERAATTVAMLCADMVEKAKSGHPGAPMGLALLGVCLLLRRLRFCHADPRWRGRTPLVLEAGHASPWLYALGHLARFDISLNDLKSFRQWGSRCPGHPEFGLTPFVEATTGPLGQGIGNAVGMALTELMLAARFNRDGYKLFGNTVHAILSEGGLMEGCGYEALSIAGHLKLGNLVVWYDSNGISIDGPLSMASSTNVQELVDALGFDYTSVDGTNAGDICALLETIDRGREERPLFVEVKTQIGCRSATKAGTAACHGAPLGPADLQATKLALGWPETPFHVPDDVRAMFDARNIELAAEVDEWNRMWEAWRAEHRDLAEHYDRLIARKPVPELYQELLAAMPAADAKPAATRALSEFALRKASALIPGIFGGSADLTDSNKVSRPGAGIIAPGKFDGLQMHFGIREAGMVTVCSGVAYHGHFRPHAATFLVFSQYALGQIRVAAIARLSTLFILSHDCFKVGEDGPTHNPVEQLMQLRAIPNLVVFRPANRQELAAAYVYALSRADGPTVIATSRETFLQPEAPARVGLDEILRGAYVAHGAEEESPVELVIVATGAETTLAIEAAKLLPQSLKSRVVSMPSTMLFKAQPEAVRERLVPTAALQVTLEAGITQGWGDIVQGLPGRILRIGIDDFCPSAPAEVLAEKLGFTPQAVAAKITAAFAS